MNEGPSDIKLQEAADETSNMLSAQIKSLEILTNLCCSSDDSEYESFDEDSCSEASVCDVGLEEGSVSMNPELKAAILETGLVNLVIDKARLPADNIRDALTQHPLGIAVQIHIITSQ